MEKHLETDGHYPYQYSTGMYSLLSHLLHRSSAKVDCSNLSLQEFNIGFLQSMTGTSWEHHKSFVGVFVCLLLVLDFFSVLFLREKVTLFTLD